MGVSGTMSNARVRAFTVQRWRQILQRGGARHSSNFKPPGRGSRGKAPFFITMRFAVRVKVDLNVDAAAAELSRTREIV